MSGARAGVDVGFNQVMRDLESEDHETLRAAIGRAASLLRMRRTNETETGEIGERFLALVMKPDAASLVRIAVALAIEHLRHPTFNELVARLSADKNGQVETIAARWLREREGSKREEMIEGRHGGLLATLLEEFERRHGSRHARAARKLAETHANALVVVGKHEIGRVIQPLFLLMGDLEQSLGAPTIDRQECQKTVRVAKERLERLRSRIDAFSRYTKELEPVFRTENVQEMILSAIDLARDQIKVKKRDLVTRLSLDAAVTVEVDRALLNEALVNVIRNGLEAYPAGARRTLRVDMRSDRRGVDIDVSDEGLGMNDEELAVAFTLFGTGKSGGSGVGLPTAERIIIAHGGRISVNSEQGKGTTVTIRVPRNRREEPDS